MRAYPAFQAICARPVCQAVTARPSLAADNCQRTRCLGRDRRGERNPRARPVCRTATAAGESPLGATVEVDVSISDTMRITVLEASVDWQNELTEESAMVSVVTPDSPDADSYGMALWPGCQTMAQAAVAKVQHMLAERPSVRVVEIGAGCGLPSLAVAACGARVLATDYRWLPLELCLEAARRQGWEQLVSAEVFDVKDESSPLPEADLVLIADIFYMKSVAVAAARRVAEARARGSAVLVSSPEDRPNGRKLFLEELQRLLPDEVIEFTGRGKAVQGTQPGDVGGPSRPPRELLVDILELPPGPAVAAVRPDSPSVMLRPAGHAFNV